MIVWMCCQGKGNHGVNLMDKRDGGVWRLRPWWERKNLDFPYVEMEGAETDESVPPIFYPPLVVGGKRYKNPGNTVDNCASLSSILSLLQCIPFLVDSLSRVLRHWLSLKLHFPNLMALQLNLAKTWLLSISLCRSRACVHSLQNSPR